MDVGGRPHARSRADALVENGTQCAHVIGVACVCRGEIRSYEKVVRTQLKLVKLLGKVAQRVLLGALVDRTPPAVPVVVQQLKLIGQPVVERNVALEAARVLIVQDILLAPPRAAQIERTKRRT